MGVTAGQQGDNEEEELVRSNALDLTARQSVGLARDLWGRLDLVAVGPPETQEGFCWVFHRKQASLESSVSEEFYREWKGW